MKYYPLIFAALAIVLAGCNSFHIDENGVVHGTGTKQFFYKSGALMLDDHYTDGKLERETWYKPDGTVIRDEHYQDGTGTGLYLYQDGTIRAKMPYVNGFAHGKATYYKPDGTLEKTVEFINGKKVE